MPSKINSTFIEVITNLYFPNTFYDFHPIALCHRLYKIISKVIAVRLKPLLSIVISSKQFRFLKGWLIHEAIGSAHEGLHTIKTQNHLVLIITIDLFKTYDCVSWLYLRLLLLHIGFELPLVKWIMCCVTIVSFVVLIQILWAERIEYRLVIVA